MIADGVRCVKQTASQKRFYMFPILFELKTGRGRISGIGKFEKVGRWVVEMTITFFV